MVEQSDGEDIRLTDLERRRTPSTRQKPSFCLAVEIRSQFPHAICFLRVEFGGKGNAELNFSGTYLPHSARVILPVPARYLACTFFTFSYILKNIQNKSPEIM
jgi:hypothetical protein